MTGFNASPMQAVEITWISSSAIFRLSSASDWACSASLILIIMDSSFLYKISVQLLQKISIIAVNIHHNEDFISLMYIVLRYKICWQKRHSLIFLSLTNINRKHECTFKFSSDNFSAILQSCFENLVLSVWISKFWSSQCKRIRSFSFLNNI